MELTRRTLDLLHPVHAELMRQLDALVAAWHFRGDAPRPASELRVVRSDAAGAAERPRLPRRPPSDNLLKELWYRIQETDAFQVAAGMAFYAFLSLPPTILVLFALTGYFGGEPAAAWLTQQLTALMPEEAAGWIDGFVASVVHTRAPGPLSIGVVLALWASSNVFMAVARALDLAYDVEGGRPFLRQRALALGVMLLFVTFFLTGSAALILGPQIAEAIEVLGIVGALWAFAQWLIPFGLIIGAFWLAYRLLPARDQAGHIREIAIGAVVGALVWLLATAGFRYYVGNFGAYDETYGVLGGVIILMLWLYLTMLVILVGGHLAAALEQRSRA